MMTDDRREILIQRAADGVASADDLAELAQAARGEPALWRQCADEMVARRLTTDGVTEAQQIASRVSLPTASRTAMPVRAWSGWAAALLLAFGWLAVSSLSPAPQGPVSVEPVRSLDDHDAPELFQAYVDRGRRDGHIIEVLPSVPIEVRTADDGTTVIFRYVRRVVEETQLDETVRLATDDAGRPRLVPQPARAVSRDAM